MGEDEIDFPEVEETDKDRLVAALLLAVSAFPTIGPLVAEAYRSSLPNQRIDRIASTVKILSELVRGLREDLLKERFRRPGSIDLLDEGLRQAARSYTEERRWYIASLLKNSLSADELSLEQEHFLLSLLGQLNDTELIILGWYGTDMVGEQADEYYRCHERVLTPPIEETGRSDQELRDDTLRQTYRDRLRSLGLVHTRGRTEQIAPLGRLLLRHIDFYSVQGMEEPS